MAEETGKKITDLAEETQLDETDLILLGSNGTSSLRKATLGAFKTWLLSTLHPVGSLYLSVSATNPSESFGGTWELCDEGYLYSTNKEEELGNTVGKSTITVKGENMPIHMHNIPAHSHTILCVKTSLTMESAGKHTHSGKGDKDTATGTGKFRYSKDGRTTYANFIPEAGAHTHVIPDHSHNIICHEEKLMTSLSGTGQPIDNMPKGMAIYVWRRVS